MHKIKSSCPPSCACWECTRRSPGWPPWTPGNWSGPRCVAGRSRVGQQPPWGFGGGAARQSLLICYWTESAARGKRMAWCRTERERERERERRRGSFREWGMKSLDFCQSMCKAQAGEVVKSGCQNFLSDWEQRRTEIRARRQETSGWPRMQCKQKRLPSKTCCKCLADALTNTATVRGGVSVPSALEWSTSGALLASLFWASNSCFNRFPELWKCTS